jgi:hypothetical protein
MRFLNMLYICLPIALCGCSPGFVGQPDFDVRVMLPPEVVDSLDDSYSDGTLLSGIITTPKKWTRLPSCDKAYGNANVNPPTLPDTTNASRDECVKDILLLIDTQYDAYERSLLGVVNGYDLTTDVTALGLTTAATLTGEKTTKTILSALAAGFIGVKAYVSSDLLASLTLPVIINQMNTDRATIHCTILTQLQKQVPPAIGAPAPQTLTLSSATTTTVTVPAGGTATAKITTTPLKASPAPAQTYSMKDAASDLIQYYKAGTIRSAMTSLQQKTGSQTTTAKQQLQNVKTTGNATDGRSTGGGPSVKTQTATGCSTS